MALLYVDSLISSNLGLEEALYLTKYLDKNPNS